MHMHKCACVAQLCIMDCMCVDTCVHHHPLEHTCTGAHTHKYTSTHKLAQYALKHTHAHVCMQGTHRHALLHFCQKNIGIFVQETQVCYCPT